LRPGNPGNGGTDHIRDGSEDVRIDAIPPVEVSLLPVALRTHVRNGITCKMILQPAANRISGT
jgi:hypothetical protein